MSLRSNTSSLFAVKLSSNFRKPQFLKEQLMVELGLFFSFFILKSLLYCNNRGDQVHLWNRGALPKEVTAAVLLCLSLYNVLVGLGKLVSVPRCRNTYQKKSVKAQQKDFRADISKMIDSLHVFDSWKCKRILYKYTIIYIYFFILFYFIIDLSTLNASQWLR